MGLIEANVTLDPIDLGKVASWSPHSKHGAINSFVGIVRSSNLDREVVAMDYDCFIPFCEKTFSEIALEAQQTWGDDTNIFILHRHGRLTVGEASIAIVATARHRDESYRITRYIIEEIKLRAPIWKKEHYKDGETEWVRGHALCQHGKGDHYEHSRDHSCGGKVHSHETR